MIDPVELAYRVYNLLLALLSPLGVPGLVCRWLSRGQPWRTLPQRFGSFPASFHQTGPGAVWLHAVSVGETVLAGRLADELRTALPGRPLYLSVGTAAGRALAEEKLAGRVDGIFFAPFDFAWAVRRVFGTLRPAALVVLETEIWPNLYREAKRFGAGLLVVNGRISDRALPRYKRFKRLFGAALEHCDAVLVQSPQDAERFVAIGAAPGRVRVTGNLKYDFEPGGARLEPVLESFLQTVSAERLLVAGSTREGEEPLVLQAFKKVSSVNQKILLVIAPRHPQRFDEAAQAIEAAGLPWVRRSALDASAPLDLPGVVLIDTLGELAAVYSRADAVFVGGSLNGWGGHNILEPALFGKPVAVGPHMQNFRDVADRLAAAGGLIFIEDAHGLSAVWARWVERPAEARAVGERARRTSESERGAAARAVEAIRQVLLEAAPSTPAGSWRRWALAPLSGVWAAGVRLRAAAYRAGLLKRRRLERFTLCVGNLSAGGTGKTPAAVWLTERLALRGRLPGILTRGYRRRSKEPSILIAPGDSVRPERTGDEAALLARRLFAPIGVGADRYKTGRRLAESFPVDTLILDDGFQHWRLERDFDLVLIDVTRPFTEDALLPAGRLREPPAALSRADAILLTRTATGGRYERLREAIRRWNPAAPVFSSRVRPVRATDPRLGGTLPLDRFAGREAFVFSGVGSPEPFRRTVEELGCRIAGELAFRDHHVYTLDNWWRIAAAARKSGAGIVLTTEKDLMNLEREAPANMRTGSPPLYVIEIDLEVDDGEALLDLIEARMGE